MKISSNTLHDILLYLDPCFDCSAKIHCKDFAASVAKKCNGKKVYQRVVEIYRIGGEEE